MMPVVTESGVRFGPSRSGSMYLSANIHRGTRPDKSQWAVERATEYGIFCAAEYSGWRCASGHYWGILNHGEKVVGTRKEKLAKFPRRSNDDDDWHGFPVSPLERGDADAPPDDFVEKWIAENVVTKTLGRRIQKRKV